MEGEVHVRIVAAEKLRDSIFLCGDALEQCVGDDEGGWAKLRDLTLEFCRVVQQLHMLLGGMEEEPFEQTIAVLDKFVGYTGYLLKKVGSTAPKHTREDIVAVRGRCHDRKRALIRKLKAIPTFRRAHQLVLNR